MREPDAIGAPPPPGGPRPPAPPATGDPGRRPDPADPGPAIPVQLNGWRVGDLGHPRVDAKVLAAIVLCGGPVGEWLDAHGVTAQALAGPLQVIQRDAPLPPAGRANAAELAALERHDSQQWRYLHSLITSAGGSRPRVIAVHLDEWPTGHLGSSETDARLLSAILVRGGPITTWLTGRIGDVTSVEQAFPGSSWS